MWYASGVSSSDVSEYDSLNLTGVSSSLVDGVCDVHGCTTLTAVSSFADRVCDVQCCTVESLSPWSEVSGDSLHMLEKSNTYIHTNICMCEWETTRIYTQQQLFVPAISRLAASSAHFTQGSGERMSCHTSHSCQYCSASRRISLYENTKSIKAILIYDYAYV